MTPRIFVECLCGIAVLSSVSCVEIGNCWLVEKQLNRLVPLLISNK